MYHEEGVWETDPGGGFMGKWFTEAVPLCKTPREKGKYVGSGQVPVEGGLSLIKE